MTAASPAPGQSGSSRAGRPLLISFVAVVVLLGAALALWPAYANREANKVTVTWAGQPVCTGTRLVRRDANQSIDEPHWVTMIDARPGMRCVITVRVHNGTGYTVQLRNVTGNFLGPGSGTAFKAAPVDGIIPRPDPNPDNDLVALYRLGHDVAPGHSSQAQLALTFRHSGCTADGWFYTAHWPAVDLHLLGRDATVTADHTLYVVGHQHFSPVRCGR